MNDSGRIDKQSFLNALSCLTQGWLSRREGRSEVSPALEWRFYVGAEVGRIAQRKLGDGLSLPRAPVQAAVDATTAAMRDPKSSLCFEATFVAEAFVARADAMRRHGSHWELIEVKQGKLPVGGDPKKVKSDYIDDAAFTAFVASSSGVSIEKCTLLLVRDDYVYGETPEALLAELDVTERVLARVVQFRDFAKKAADALLGNDRPEPALKLECRGCQFYDTTCLGVGVDDPLFDIPGLREKKFEEIKSYGRITSLPTDVKLTGPQERVVGAVRSGKPIVEPDGLSHLSGVVWPAYYLDFEAVMPVLPWFEGTHPYETMPFQFSLHVCASPGARPAHFEYLAPRTGDWREELAEKLVSAVGSSGSILMYSPYELRMMKYLAAVIPRLADALNPAKDRLFDLEPIFEHGYYHPGFRGRTSIKETLPTMVPDLTYEGLEVRGGNDAAGVFALMRVGHYSPEDEARHRRSLLEYCKLDSLAMVRLHGALLDIRSKVG